jgi:hypothetical protein
MSRQKVVCARGDGTFYQAGIRCLKSSVEVVTRISNHHLSIRKCLQAAQVYGDLGNRLTTRSYQTSLDTDRDRLSHETGSIQSEPPVLR